MVTKIVVRISSEGKAASAEQSIHDIINDTDEICDAERGDYKIISTQLCDIQGIPNKAAAGGIICDEHSHNNNDVSFPCEPIDSNADDEKEEDSRERNDDNAGKKRPLLMGQSGNIIEKTKRRRSADKIIDLTDVPPQEPILRSIKSNVKARVKGGTSKYTGVTFIKTTIKWQARITLDGKQHSIGYYDNEEEAAVDYARAAFKYRSDLPKKFIDLTDVPPQAPVLRNVKGGTSKYTGVAFSKSKNKWQANISLDGMQHSIGYYEDEEEAAVDYARAAFKYDAGRLERARAQGSKQKFIDLSDVPRQLPIMSSKSGGCSKYTGVTFRSKAKKKWQAKIALDGKQHSIGYYEDEEEAAVDYARAVFKYKTSCE